MFNVQPDKLTGTLQIYISSFHMTARVQQVWDYVQSPKNATEEVKNDLKWSCWVINQTVQSEQSPAVRHELALS